MIQGLRVLAIVTARGGSKGLPGKNIRPLAGKPLIAWSVEAGRASAYVDRVLVSSDDPAIIAAAVAAGADAPFVRPAELAKDDTPSAPVLLHALDNAGADYDIVVLLQPTSPLRDSGDIDGCLRTLVETGAPSCVSVVEPSKSPYWMYRMSESGRLERLINAPQATRRQDLPTVYALNGAVYAARVPWFRATGGLIGDDTVGWVMPPERSVDIDGVLDFRLAELLLEG